MYGYMQLQEVVEEIEAAVEGELGYGRVGFVKKHCMYIICTQ